MTIKLNISSVIMGRRCKRNGKIPDMESHFGNLCRWERAFRLKLELLVPSWSATASIRRHYASSAAVLEISNKWQAKCITLGQGVRPLRGRARRTYESYIDIDSDHCRLDRIGSNC